MTWSEAFVLGVFYIYAGFLAVMGTLCVGVIIGWVITGAARLLGKFLFREPPVPRGQRYARRRTPYDRSPASQAAHSAVAPAGSGVTDGDALGPSAQLNALFAALRISTATITESILPHQVDPVTRRCQHCGADDRAILFYRNTDTPIRCVPATHEVAAEMAVATQQPVVRPANQRCERSIIIE